MSRLAFAPLQKQCRGHGDNSHLLCAMSTSETEGDQPRPLRTQEAHETQQTTWQATRKEHPPRHLHSLRDNRRSPFSGVRVHESRHPRGSLAPAAVGVPRPLFLLLPRLHPTPSARREDAADGGGPSRSGGGRGRLRDPACPRGSRETPRRRELKFFSPPSPVRGDSAGAIPLLGSLSSLSSLLLLPPSSFIFESVFQLFFRGGDRGIKQPSSETFTIHFHRVNKRKRFKEVKRL